MAAVCAGVGWVARGGGVCGCGVGGAWRRAPALMTARASRVGRGCVLRCVLLTRLIAACAAACVTSRRRSVVPVPVSPSVAHAGGAVDGGGTEYTCDVGTALTQGAPVPASPPAPPVPIAADEAAFQSVATAAVGDGCAVPLLLPCGRGGDGDGVGGGGSGEGESIVGGAPAIPATVPGAPAAASSTAPAGPGGGLGDDGDDAALGATPRPGRQRLAAASMQVGGRGPT